MISRAKNSMVRKIFIAYFLATAFLMTTVFAFFCTQSFSGKEAERVQQYQYKNNLLTQVIDEKFSYVERVATQIRTSNWVKYAGSDARILYERLDSFQKKDICKMIGNSNDLFGVAKSTAVIFPKKNLVIDKLSFWESESYFKSIGLYPEMLGELEELLKNQYTTQILFTNENIYADNHSFIIAKRLRFQDKAEILFIYVDGKQFDKFISNRFPEMEEFEILYEEMPLYTYMNSNEESRDIFYEQVEPSNLYNWSYHCTWRMGESIASLFWLYFGVGCLALLVPELLIAYLLTLLSQRTVFRLAEKMGLKKQYEEHGMDAIESAFLKLSNEKNWMEWQANQYYAIAHEGFILGLLRGTLQVEMMETYSEKFNLQFNNEMDYQVLAINDIDNQEGKDYTNALLELQIQCYHKKMPIVVYQREQIHLIILSTLSGMEDLYRQEEQIKVFLDEIFTDMELELVCGTPCHGLAGISRSYQSVKKKLTMMDSTTQILYYYPLDAELALVNDMRIGNFEAAEKILREIHMENSKRGLSFIENLHVIQMLFEVLCRFAEEIQLDKNKLHYDISDFLNARDEQAMWNQLLEIFHRLEILYRENRNIKELGKEIMDYVDAHFRCSELSQQEIADVFHVSRPTVSKVFKETARMNFVDYLHKRRVEQAKVLFEQGNLSVIEIAKQVGYENEVTFKRAFQKNESMTPREYVKMRRIR